MTIKQQVLEILENNKGQSISGEKIAKQLFCSRNAVWKSVDSLKKEGYKIEASTNKGYVLSEQNDILSIASVEKHLKSNCYLLVKDNVSSTNTLLKELAEKEAKEGTVIIATSQSAGKGRLGRTFFSPQSGLYLSILLRPKFSAEKSLFITTAAAVAVAETVQKYTNKKVGIKWVNDIFIETRKVCGILTEASIDFETKGLNYAVLGIGVNVCNPPESFPDELKNIATAIFDEEPKDKEIKSKIAAQIIDNFFDIYNNIDSSNFMEKYRKHSILIGKELTVVQGETRTPAKAIGIDNDAHLIVEYKNGETKTLSSGEVSVKL